MRLTNQQISAIKATAAECFGEGVRVYLFGSRVNDNDRGGDIDLYIELDEGELTAVLEAKHEFLARLKQRIGDQRIDVVVNTPARRHPPPVVAIARQTAIRL